MFPTDVGMNRFNFTREAVFYWRTKDKKEIDFILRIRNSILPIEVKMNFEQFNPSAVRYFNKHYGLKDFKVVGLQGRPKDKNYTFPWDI